MLGLCEPGDEVLAFDPYYDSYARRGAMAGARLVPVPLHPPDCTFDPTSCAPRSRPQARVILRQLAAQPDRRACSRARSSSAIADRRASSTT